MIGSNVGQVYTGQQGNQLATVLGPSRALASYEGYVAKKAAEKSRDGEDLSKGVGAVKPEETWHYYSQDLNSRWEKWSNQGASLMPKGNPFKRYDDEAIRWQIEGARIKAANENIKQAKVLWDKAMGDINTRGDEYTDEYKDKVKNFAANNPIDVVASGKFDFPQAEFKNPSTIHQDYMVNGLGILQKGAGDRVLTDADFNNYSISYFSTPEAEKNVIAAKQMFDSLDDASKNEYISQAQNTPGFGGQGWLALANDQLKSRYKKPTLDIAGDALKKAQDAPIKTTSSTTEDLSSVTTGASRDQLANAAYPTQQATSYFTKNSWALNEPEYMQALGVDPNLPLEERRKKAISAFAKQIKDNIETKSEYSLSRGGAGTASTKEINISYDKWRTNLTSGDRATSTEAANWLVGGLGMKNTEITSAFVSSNDYSLNAKGRGIYDTYKAGKAERASKFKVLQIVFKNPSEMEAAKEKYFKASSDALNPDDQETKNLLNYYRTEANPGGGTVLKVPIMVENEQIIKRFHDNNVRATKQLYTPIGNKYQSGTAVQQQNKQYFDQKPTPKIEGGFNFKLNN